VVLHTGGDRHDSSPLVAEQSVNAPLVMFHVMMNEDETT
jgi:hypothetical protein